MNRKITIPAAGVLVSGNMEICEFSVVDVLKFCSVIGGSGGTKKDIIAKAIFGLLPS